MAPAAAAGKRLESSEPASEGEANLLALQDEDALLSLKASYHSLKAKFMAWVGR